MKKENMIVWIAQIFIDKLSSDDLKSWMDHGLDLIENKIKASPTTMDDKILLPIVKLIRKAFDIEDND